MQDVRIDVHDAVDITSVGAADVDDVRSEDVAVLLKPFQPFLLQTDTFFLSPFLWL